MKRVTMGRLVYDAARESSNRLNQERVKLFKEKGPAAFPGARILLVNNGGRESLLFLKPENK